MGSISEARDVDSSVEEADREPFAPEVSVVMPCLNEALTLEVCIAKARDAMALHDISGEVIIADNGSSDGSQRIARQAGARVVDVERKGYGSALLGGIAAARGKYVIMGDADDSYDFTHIPRFVERLREGNELVMGNRFLGGIMPGAMPPLHRYLGNPVLSGIGRLLFHSPSGDFHCGLRGFSKRAIDSLGLKTPGMEFASEMVVKATIHELKICEVPTTLSPDGRDRPPHLRSWRDGWRHLRFMLLFSPRWLFFYPGALLALVGVFVMACLLPGARTIGGVTFDVHSLLFAAAAILVGFQAVLFSLLGKVFGMNTGLMPYTPFWKRLFRRVGLETGLVFGGALFLTGLGLSIGAVGAWSNVEFGPLDAHRTLRLVIPAALLLVLGCQIVMSSFFFSVLGLIQDERD